MQITNMPISISLEPFSEADFDRLIAWSSTAEFLLQWAGPLFTFPLDRSQLENYLAATRQNLPKAFAYRAVDMATHAVVGHIEIGNIDQRNSSARLSRVLIGAVDSRGRGLGQQVVRVALRIAFEDLHLHRVDLTVFDFNVAAIHCYERVGFKFEGLLREAARSGDSYWNACVMSILHQE
jgi:RimJ/RimL family protein N-acetyltransferase